MASVTLQNIVKYYDQTALIGGGPPKPALNNINLSIEEGETISIVGPSGCGKSTLLKVIAGLEAPNEGRVLYNNHDVTATNPQDRGVGMVFQDYALYPSREGEGNLSYYFEVRKKTEAEKQQRLKETAELMGVGFDMLLGRLPDTLSGGEKQRVGIARCIVRDPNVFLMDEPISNLDAKLRERTRTEMKRLLNKFKITTVYVTHDQQEAIFMGSRIVVMRGGMIEQFGTFDDLYYAPANLFVAEFIGTPPISVIPVRVENARLFMDGADFVTREGKPAASGEIHWMLPSHLRTQVPNGRLRMGVRPEGWQVGDANGEGAAFPVSHIERLYTERAAFLYGAIRGAMVSALVPLDFHETDSVRLIPNWDQVYFFTAEGEEALYVPGVPEFF